MVLLTANIASKSYPYPISQFKIRRINWKYSLYFLSDDLVQLCVDYIKEYPLIVGACGVVFLLLCLGFFFLLRSEEPKPRKSKKKKNKDQDSNGVDSGKKTKSSKKDN